MKNRELKLFLKIALGVLLLGLLTIVLLSLFNGCTPKGWQTEVPARAAVLDAQPELVSYPIEAEERISIMLPGVAGQYELLRRAEELTGIAADYEFVPADRYGQEFVLRITGLLYPDLFYRNTSIGEFLNFPDKNAATELSDLAAQFAPNYLAALQRDPQLARRVFEGNEGWLLSFFQLRSGPAQPEQGLFIRADWLEQLGMGVPSTYDEYEAVLCAFRDEIGCEQPLALWHSGAFPGDLLAAGFGTTSYVGTRNAVELGNWLQNKGFFVRDGQVLYGPAEPAYLDYLRMMNRWYEMDLFTSDYVTWQDERDYDFLVLESKTGLFYADSVRGPALIQNIHDSGTAVPAPDPIQQPGQIHHLGSQEPSIATDAAFCISEGCERAALCVRWCDFWYSEAGVTLLSETLEPELCFDWLPTLPGIHDPAELHRLADLDTQLLWDTWSVSCDNAWRLSADLVLSQNDQHRMEIILKDLSETVLSFTNRVILGEESVDSFDEYLKQLEHCGLSHAIACIESYLKAE